MEEVFLLLFVHKKKILAFRLFRYSSRRQCHRPHERRPMQRIVLARLARHHQAAAAQRQPHFASFCSTIAAYSAEPYGVHSSLKL